MDIAYGSDPQVLKAHLELHFINIIKCQLKKEMLEAGDLNVAVNQAIDEPD
jgi:hypothetical protein